MHAQYSLAVQQKVLELVQAWANELQPATFRDVYRRLQVCHKTLKNMWYYYYSSSPPTQKKKVRFPPPDRQRPPIAVAPPPVIGTTHDDATTHNSATSNTGGRPMPGFSNMGGPHMGAPVHQSFSAAMAGTIGGAPGSTLPQRPRPPNRAAAIQEVQEAKNTASFLDELLKEIEDNDPASVTQEHVYDLAQQCLAFKFSMNDLASFETDESVLASAIAAHEELDRVVSKYTDMLSYGPSAGAPARQTNGGQVRGCLCVIVVSYVTNHAATIFSYITCASVFASTSVFISTTRRRATAWRAAPQCRRCQKPRLQSRPPTPPTSSTSSSRST